MFEIVKVKPIGRRETSAFLDFAPGKGRSGFYSGVQMPVYPDSPRGEAMCQHRTGLVPDAPTVEKKIGIGTVSLREPQAGDLAHISLGEAARALGLTPEQVSGLEHGRYVFADDADWQRAADMIDALRPEKVAP